ncbi:hypothetical protein PQX77_019401 [Marasmius sp. AFHP31]|nr:hypothetical protein PQX77_019401 [Marasmius sp. AFHP31]
MFRASKTRELEPVVKYLRDDDIATAWVTVVGLTAALMNVIADIMLIHRCYIVWESSRILLYSLSSAASILNGIQIAVSIITSVANVDPSVKPLARTARRVGNGCQIAIAMFSALLSLLTVVLMGLLASRIWWISREARRHMGMPVHARYKAIVAALLESGSLYPTILVVASIVTLIVDPNSSGTIPIDLNVVASLMSGLAPTLIIVRVAYGKSVESVQQMVSIHFAENETRLGPSTGGIRATVEIRSCTGIEVLEAGNTEGTKSEARMSQSRIV